MDFMFVTDPMSQREISELKLDAEPNMLFMLVTDPTFQFDISELKLDAS